MGLPFQVGGRRRRRLSKKDEEKRAMLQRMWEATLIEHTPIDAHFRLLDELMNIPSYGVPASAKAIAGLPMPPPPPASSPCPEEHDHGVMSGGRCAICLEDLDARHCREKLRMMPCHHCFHQICIFDWLLINRLCPICQFALPSTQEQRLLDEEQAAPPVLHHGADRHASGRNPTQPMI